MTTDDEHLTYHFCGYTTQYYIAARLTSGRAGRSTGSASTRLLDEEHRRCGDRDGGWMTCTWTNQ